MCAVIGCHREPVKGRVLCRDCYQGRKVSLDFSKGDEREIFKYLWGATTWIYFISCGDSLVKIGKATNVANRFHSLQTGSPHELKLLAAIRTEEREEKKLHEHFKEQKERGEWFRVDESIKGFLRCLVDGEKPPVLNIVLDVRFSLEDLK